MNLEKILQSLCEGRLDLITPDIVYVINKMTMHYLQKDNIDKDDLKGMKDIILISNILYNNTDRNILPLEDGIYDLLIVKYNKLTNGLAPVGAPPIDFGQSTNEGLLEMKDKGQELTQVVRRVQGREDMLFFNALTSNSRSIPSDFEYNEDNTLISKGIANVAHDYPELVGTLHKCKFVLNKQAAERGLLSGPDAGHVMVFERDFFDHHHRLGFTPTQLIAELKYDGVSVEAEINRDTIISAHSRGDTANDEAKDLTPIFGGYKFHRATDLIPKGTKFGIKFEAIITYENLMLIKERFGKSYANARNAIIGLTSGLDSRKFRDYITLVPLACSKDLGIIDREVEIKFLNKYYSSGVDLRYEILNGDYTTLLFLVKRFVEEAEYMRPFLPFMYDGIVVSHTDPDIIRKLGRVNSINMYTIAIKFNAMKKQTIFTNYTYTIGQNGLVVPMAHFNPIEFIGAIHTKTTIHSLRRFIGLGMRAGDIVDIEYVHDVICYLSKPDNSHNAKNPNPIIEFPEVCPSCGSELFTSDSGDSAYCMNFNCPERNVARMTNMMKKLNIKDFSTQAIRTLGIYNLSNLLQLDQKIAMEKFGNVNGVKLMERIEQIRNLDYPDYRVIGSIGFSSIAAEKWKLILANMSIEKLIGGSDDDMKMLSSVKGIGGKAISTIIAERQFFIPDLIAISKMPNLERTFGEMDARLTVRFTGVRDEELAKVLSMSGYDADGEKSVTKQTNILIVPYFGYTSSKTNKVGPNCRIMPVDEVWANINSKSKVTHF